MNTCESCQFWTKGNPKGVCTLSQTQNPKMEAKDEPSAYEPYLATAPTFGCTEHKAK